MEYSLFVFFFDTHRFIVVVRVSLHTDKTVNTSHRISALYSGVCALLYIICALSDAYSTVK